MDFQWKVSIIFTLVLVYGEILNVAGSGHRFGYTKPEQRRWSMHHGSCAGKYQSPISINSNKAIPIYMPAVEFVGYHNLLPGPIQIHNNGHSASLTIPKQADGSTKLPYIFGGKLSNEYDLEGLHFHWGDKNNRGSEHVLNDIRYPLEMHIIHKNRKYATVAEALTYTDGLAVLGFFYQVKEKEGLELHSIVKSLANIEDYDKSIKLNTTFTLQSLIGEINLDRFYTYKGSLTTPPCSEAVTWIIFPDTLTVSVSQMNKFRHLSNGIDGSVLVDNFRALQPLGNRRIFLRKFNSRHTPLDALVNNEVQYAKWDWLY